MACSNCQHRHGKREVCNKLVTVRLGRHKVGSALCGCKDYVPPKDF